MKLIVVAALCLVICLGAIALVMAMLHCCLHTRDDHGVVVMHAPDRPDSEPVEVEADDGLVAMLDAMDRRRVPPEGWQAGGRDRSG